MRNVISKKTQHAYQVAEKTEGIRKIPIQRPQWHFSLMHASQLFG